jgi:hypothetical protein
MALHMNRSLASDAWSACHSGQRAIALRGAEIMSDDIFGLQAGLFTAGAAHVLGALSAGRKQDTRLNVIAWLRWSWFMNLLT